MKKNLMFLLIALLSIGMSVSAQDSIRGKRMNEGRRAQGTMQWTAKDRAAQMEKQLSLTADQKAKVQALFEKQEALRKEQVEKARENRDKMTANRDEMRKQMQAVREKAISENDSQLEQIIGKEKMEQWKAFRAERRDSMSVRRGDSGRRPNK